MMRQTTDMKRSTVFGLLVDVVAVGADADDADQRLDRRIDAARAVFDEIADIDEIRPAGLAQRIDDRRALGVDEILAARFGEHQRLGVVEHFQLEPGAARSC